MVQYVYICILLVILQKLIKAWFLRIVQKFVKPWGVIEHAGA
ncbi:MAG: hypothetical protein N2Z58_02115 [Fervidobacterium sp.]|nr:hypothetical protein [Fervidobacterium sp.]